MKGSTALQWVVMSWRLLSLKVIEDVKIQIDQDELLEVSNPLLPQYCAWRRYIVGMQKAN